MIKIDGFCFLQLSGWTSNLVDILMGHHFSTVTANRDTAVFTRINSDS